MTNIYTSSVRSQALEPDVSISVHACVRKKGRGRKGLEPQNCHLGQVAKYRVLTRCAIDCRHRGGLNRGASFYDMIPTVLGLQFDNFEFVHVCN